MIDVKLKIPFSLIGILLISLPINPKAQLTFLYNYGRLGDVFTDIARNIYLSEKYGVALCINTTIPYVHHFTIEKTYDIKSLHKRKKILYREITLRFARSNTAYICHRHTLVDVGSQDLGDFLFKYYIENIDFRSKIKTHLSLRETFIPPLMPDNHISVAVHIRKGSGTDTPLLSQQYAPQRHSDVYFCLKFPPEQYYVDHILLLREIFQAKPLYIRIFTDDKNPIALMQRIKQRVAYDDIIFDYQSPESEIADLYAMSCFDLLIRANSAFSQTAQFIGNHKAIIMPTKSLWEKDYLRITDSAILIPDREKHLLYSIQASHENIGEIKALYGLSTH